MKKIRYTMTDTETGRMEEFSAVVPKDAAELAAILERNSRPKRTYCVACGDETDGRTFCNSRTCDATDTYDI